MGDSNGGNLGQPWAASSAPLRSGDRANPGGFQSWQADGRPARAAAKAATPACTTGRRSTDPTTSALLTARTRPTRTTSGRA